MSLAGPSSPRATEPNTNASSMRADSGSSASRRASGGAADLRVVQLTAREGSIGRFHVDHYCCLSHNVLQGFSLLEFPERGNQALEVLGRVALETRLVHVHEAIGRPAPGLAGAGGILAPLAQPVHLLRQVEVGTGLPLDAPPPAGGG